MTDLEKFIDTYKQFGIELNPELTIDDTIRIVLRADDPNPKLDGWAGFESDLYFTKEGKFIKQGFWE